MAMEINGIQAGLPAAQSGKGAPGANELFGFLDAVQRQYAQSIRHSTPPKTSEDVQEDFWTRHMKEHYKNVEFIKQQWLKQEILQAQVMRNGVTDPEGEKAVYLQGVPAYLLLGDILL